MFCLKITINSKQLFLSEKHAKKKEPWGSFWWWDGALNKLLSEHYDGSTQIEVKFEGETFWLSLNQISSLFEKDKSVISRHISNIYREGELDRSSTVAKNTTVQFEANRQVKRDIEYYNLDAIISVGYRVNSKRGTQFRQWATKRLEQSSAGGLLCAYYARWTAMGEEVGGEVGEVLHRIDIDADLNAFEADVLVEVVEVL